MESIKRFFRDETATAEATSTVVMIAGAGILLATALTIWYTGLGTIFTAFSGAIAGWSSSFDIPG